MNRTWQMLFSYWLDSASPTEVMHNLVCTRKWYIYWQVHRSQKMENLSRNAAIEKTSLMLGEIKEMTLGFQKSITDLHPEEIDTIHVEIEKGIWEILLRYPP